VGEGIGVGLGMASTVAFTLAGTVASKLGVGEGRGVKDGVYVGCGVGEGGTAMVGCSQDISNAISGVSTRARVLLIRHLPPVERMARSILSRRVNSRGAYASNRTTRSTAPLVVP